MTIVDVTPFVVNLSPKSNWFFVRVVADDGLHGYGEATLYGFLRRLSPSRAPQPSTRSRSPRTPIAILSNRSG